MRLWSIHPSYLDTKGLVASWREALLAQKVLIGETKGYTKHPQLQRFRECKLKKKIEASCADSVAAVGAFLHGIHSEAIKRNYNFDHSKILYYKEMEIENRIPVKYGQLQYEFSWLLSKLKERDPKKYKELSKLPKDGDKFIGLQPHPCFEVINNDMSVESWEKISESPKKSPQKSGTKRKRSKKVKEEEDDDLEIENEDVVQIPQRITRSQTKRSRVTL